KYTEAHPELTNYLVRTLARRLREADDALAAATFLSVKGRLARALLNLAEYVGKDNGGGQIQLHHKISQSDLAAMAGVARENVSRTMSDGASGISSRDHPITTASTIGERWRRKWSSRANA